MDVLPHGPPRLDEVRVQPRLDWEESHRAWALCYDAPLRRLAFPGGLRQVGSSIPWLVVALVVRVRKATLEGGGL